MHNCKAFGVGRGQAPTGDGVVIRFFMWPRHNFLIICRGAERNIFKGVSSVVVVVNRKRQI